MRNDDLDVVLLRMIGAFFCVLIVGYISQINRELLPERYERGPMADDSDKIPD